MLWRLFTAVTKFNKTSWPKNIETALSRFSKTSKIISSHPCIYLNHSNNSKLNLGSYLGKFETKLIVRNMSSNAESEQLASVSSEQDLSQPDADSLDCWLEEDLENLNALEESYQAARQESASKWLDYNKTCYIYLYRGGGQPSNSMAAFDLDGTIIKPKSNKRIPKSATDWQFFSVWTKVKIQQALRDNQSRFVIFTNQNGVGLRLVPLEEVQERIELVTKRLNIPCTVFVAIDKDEFRKPNVGMYKLFQKSFNGSKSIDKERSFYCGDAVGYPSHSDADIKFAQTLRLPFLPPEKFLRGVKPKQVELSK